MSLFGRGKPEIVDPYNTMGTAPRKAAGRAGNARPDRSGNRRGKATGEWVCASHARAGRPCNVLLGGYEPGTICPSCNGNPCQ